MAVRTVLSGEQCTRHRTLVSVTKRPAPVIAVITARPSVHACARPRPCACAPARPRMPACASACPRARMPDRAPELPAPRLSSPSCLCIPVHVQLHTLACPNVHPTHPNALPKVPPSYLTLDHFLDSFLVSRDLCLLLEHVRNDSKRDGETSWNPIWAMGPLGFLQGEVAESLIDSYGLHEASSPRFESVLGFRVIHNFNNIALKTSLLGNMHGFTIRKPFQAY
ncbi:hypothetical protein CRG98_028520 [Punica granatum]|uniref:Uncharacterized protein n=1 Tax=Punica granatum TaxID=22663 RepID=A0A2I0J4E1_PUNGR|nr:hypothetical protein CRG98_028520 [Punica granatum]